MIKRKTNVVTKLCFWSILSMSLPLYSGAQDSEGGALMLVKEGVPAATIVIDKNPTKAAVFAADELNDHIRRITGTKLPVQSADIAGNAQGLKICVGESPETRKLGLKSDDFADQEYTVLNKPGVLVLMGKDDPVPGILKYPAALPDNFENHATCSAVYDFLEKFCDVRWFGPGEIGLCHPVTKTLAVNCKDINIRRKPAFMYRYPYPILTPSQDVKALFGNQSSQDMKLFSLRFRAGGEKYRCCHSFYGYYDRFYAKNTKNEKAFEGSHPEYFAKGYEGQPPQLCYTNDALIKQVAKDVMDYFDGKSNHLGSLGDYAILEPMDTRDYCKCQKCQALMDHNTGGFKCCNGEVSKYWFTFVNKVAREVADKHPDKFVATLAYASHAYCPQGMKIAPNVCIQMCLATRHWPWSPSMKRNELKTYQEWIQEGEGKRGFYLWLYYCFPSLSGQLGGFNDFPGYFAHSLSEQIKMFAKDGVRGVLLENDDDFSIDVYFTQKLLDDSSLNIDDLINDFFTKYYGAAAKPMKEFYLFVEDVYSNPKNYPQEIQAGLKDSCQVTPHQTEEIAWKYLGTDERMKKLADLIEKAEKAAVILVEKKRVGLFKSTVWEKMVAGKTRYEYKEKYKDEVEKVKNSLPPEMNIPKMDKNANGNLKSVDFSRAATFKNWYTTYGYSPDRKITGKAAYDDKYLYLELVDHTSPAKLNSSGGVWPGDDWEIFFTTSRETSLYRQIGVNPAGNIAMLSDKTEYKSGAIVESDTKQTDRWVVKMAIPLADVLKEGAGKGSSFYMNIVRGTKTGGDNLAWSALFNNAFFTPARLGKVTLAD